MINFYNGNKKELIILLSIEKCDKLIVVIIMKKKFKEYDITIDSTRKFYDDEENRIVLDINIKIKDPNTGAYSIFTESI